MTKGQRWTWLKKFAQAAKNLKHSSTKSPKIGNHKVGEIQTLRVLRDLRGEPERPAGTRNLFHSLLRAPGNHGTHAASRACFMEARLEELVNLWILVFVLDLRAALFDADLDWFVVAESDKVVTPAIPT